MIGSICEFWFLAKLNFLGENQVLYFHRLYGKYCPDKPDARSQNHLINSKRILEMKKFVAVLIIALASAGISFAGGCSSSKSYTMANSSKALKGDVVLMAEGKRVIKHDGKLGQIFFTIQTDSGETLAQEISREEFGIQFPELSRQIQSWAISFWVGSSNTSHSQVG